MQRRFDAIMTLSLRYVSAGMSEWNKYIWKRCPPSEFFKWAAVPSVLCCYIVIYISVYIGVYKLHSRPGKFCVTFVSIAGRINGIPKWIFDLFLLHIICLYVCHYHIPVIPWHDMLYINTLTPKYGISTKFRHYLHEKVSFWQPYWSKAIRPLWKFLYNYDRFSVW